MDIHITDYSKQTMSGRIIHLFKEIYPDWSSEEVKKMVYDENKELHVSTQVAVCNEKIVGHANVFRLTNDSKIANLGFHVHADYRRKRIGTRLATTVMDKAKESGIKIIVAQTESTNQAAISLLEKLGFKKPSIIFLHEYADGLKYRRLENGVCLYKEI
jgi:RimJ/RimL family protein N-acetyltransferase